MRQRRQMDAAEFLNKNSEYYRIKRLNVTRVFILTYFDTSTVFKIRVCINSNLGLKMKINEMCFDNTYVGSCASE